MEHKSIVKISVFGLLIHTAVVIDSKIKIVSKNCVFVFAGGTYLLDINIPDSYPFNPPKVFEIIA